VTGFDALTIIAAAAEATARGPVERTPRLRAALNRLLASAKGDHWPFDQLWDAVGVPLASAWSATESNNFRHCQCHAALRGIMRAVGYRDDIDGWGRLMAASRSSHV
jgi:hypothetical protein